MKKSLAIWLAAVTSSALLLFLIVPTVGVVSSCSPIESNTNPIKLSPMLDLKAYITNVKTSTNTNFYIGLQFKGFNTEDYFSGYAVYVADNLYDLTNETNSFRMIPNASASNTTATVSGLTPITDPNTYTYNIKYDTNYASLVPGASYYVFVKAFAYTYLVYSLPSNFTNVVYTN